MVLPTGLSLIKHPAARAAAMLFAAISAAACQPAAEAPASAGRGPSVPGPASAAALQIPAPIAPSGPSTAAAEPQAVVASSPAAAADALRGPADCRFAVPEGWDARDVRWTGTCRDGFAHGAGVLREFVGGKVARIFFGTLANGRPTLGAIEVEGGYVAGRFEAGRAADDGDRNTLLRAFREASAAAATVADGYRRAGNAASADFYQAKAKRLAEQMD